MKKLSTYLFLVLFSFQTSSLGEDIRDFEIEGMTTGDSLLDFFTEKEILSNNPNWFKDNEYSIANNLTSKNFETYELLQVAYKTNDKKYTIESIEGYKFYYKINNCFKDQNIVIDDISNLIPQIKKGEKTIYTKHFSSGKSEFTEVRFTFDSGDGIFIQCVDSEGYSPPYAIDLRVVLRNKEYSYFLLNRAY